MKPSIDKWIKEAKKDKDAKKCGMYLSHVGVVREDAKAKVRFGDENAKHVTAMEFDYDAIKVQQAIEETYKLEGIYYVRVHLEKGKIKVGHEIMYVLIGGDIRPNVTKALDFLVSKLKNECVQEKELFCSIK